MNVTKEAKKTEAIKRLEELVRKYGLNPNTVKYFKEDRLYYSYLTGGGFIGSIDTINYDERYVEAVKDFENSRNCLVYHVIETGNVLSFLYISDYESDWEEERPMDGEICAYVYPLEEPDWSEVGYIRIAAYQGALIRIG